MDLPLRVKILTHFIRIRPLRRTSKLTTGSKRILPVMVKAFRPRPPLPFAIFHRLSHFRLDSHIFETGLRRLLFFHFLQSHQPSLALCARAQLSRGRNKRLEEAGQIRGSKLLLKNKHNSNFKGDRCREL